MRSCSRCYKPDARITLRGEDCTCGHPLAEFGPDDEHEPHCHRVGHEVVEFVWPHIYRERELIRDAARATHGYTLPESLLRAGWVLREYRQRGRAIPGRYVRVRLLCRTCIVEEMDLRDRLKDYERSVKRAGGSKVRTGWAASVAMQDSL